MAQLRGGTTIGGYLALHSGMDQATIAGSLLVGEDFQAKAIYIPDDSSNGITFAGSTARTWIRNASVSMESSTGGTILFRGSRTITLDTSAGTMVFAADAGCGLRFWNNSNNSIHVATTSDTTWGGSVSGAATSDYNMYFKMATGTNRGFVFLSGSTPRLQIDASGNVFCTGTVQNAHYNDLAERFEKDEELEPGDVVAKSTDSEGYIKSTKAYDPLVVGVVSDSAGYILGGEKGETQEEKERIYAPVGMAGRVQAKVIGKVKIGDLLVASDTPGVAMAAERYIPGTVIGKALEPYDNTETVGRIKILILNA